MVLKHPPLIWRVWNPITSKVFPSSRMPQRRYSTVHEEQTESSWWLQNQVLRAQSGSMPGLKPTLILTGDRKGTRLNSSHVKSSYGVFCVAEDRALGRLTGQ